MVFPDQTHLLFSIACSAFNKYWTVVFDANLFLIANED